MEAEVAVAATEHWSAMGGTLPLVEHDQLRREATLGQVPRVLAGGLAKMKIVPPSCKVQPEKK